MHGRSAACRSAGARWRRSRRGIKDPPAFVLYGVLIHGIDNYDYSVYY